MTNAPGIPSTRARRSGRIVALTLACLAGSLAFGTSIAGAEITTIEGSALRIFVSDDGHLNAQVKGTEDYTFYPPDDEAGNAGIQFAFPDTSSNAESPPPFNFYGFSSGEPFVPDEVLTPAPVSGDGTPQNPYSVTVTYRAVEPEQSQDQLEITQTVTHVSGTTRFRVDYSIKNVAGKTRNFRIFEAADLYLAGSDDGLGNHVAGPPQQVLGVNSDTGVSGGLIEVPGSEFSHWQVGSFNDIVDNIPNDSNGSGYDDTLPDPAEGPIDNGVGVQWDSYFSQGSGLAAGATATRSVIWQFAAPVQGKAATVAPVDGTVLVQRPGSNEYSPLGAEESLPVGSTVDTRSGTVRLNTKGSGGTTQSADFRDGIFKILQTKGSPLTTLKLTGPLEGCGRTSAARSRSTTVRGGKGRSLWGSGKGKFRTSGKRGSGSVRGTTWKVTDNCDGSTRIQSLKGASQGKVDVKDFGNPRKRIVLNPGQSYLARPGK